MGNWQLEVAKMAVYMAFPVTSFYVYHQVANFADILSQHHKLLVLAALFHAGSFVSADLICFGHVLIRSPDSGQNFKLFKCSG